MRTTRLLTVSPACTAQGVGRYLPGGMSAQGEGCVCPGGMADTPRERNDRCNNNTFVAGGKDVRDSSARFTSTFFIYLTDMNDPGCESTVFYRQLSFWVRRYLFWMNAIFCLSSFSLFCAHVQLKFGTVQLLATLQLIFFAHCEFNNYKYVFQ